MSGLVRLMLVAGVLVAIASPLAAEDRRPAGYYSLINDNSIDAAPTGLAARGRFMSQLAASDPCATDIDIVINGVVFRMPRTLVNVSRRGKVVFNGTASRQDRDCVTQRVEADSVYVYTSNRIGLGPYGPKEVPRRFEISAVTIRDGRTFPQGRYRIYREMVDAVLAGDKRVVTESGLYRHATLGPHGGLFVVPPARYTTPMAEPLVIFCSPGPTTECSASYRFDERIHLTYWFEDHLFPQTEWIPLDQRMRNYVQNIRQP